ncbi:lead, cadmium, zinc and mercury transporting ATPase [Lentilactobacillus kosonis]|uniref:Lead, cadmium, zinc and mercury transporting ATPase n=1 Tax=Lentilactobacillus kosonis TaxID=2810561 RepID=A0A401FM14_9LACO|nr:lead, cadmium, zinc and mercury transporting ATPase [Lentilactobacillus kosonis]
MKNSQDNEMKHMNHDHMQMEHSDMDGMNMDHDHMDMGSDDMMMHGGHMMHMGNLKAKILDISYFSYSGVIFSSHHGTGTTNY